LVFDATLARLSDQEAIAVAEKWQHHGTLFLLYYLLAIELLAFQYLLYNLMLSGNPSTLL
jgi:hypothetical protein